MKNIEDRTLKRYQSLCVIDRTSSVEDFYDVSNFFCFDCNKCVLVHKKDQGSAIDLAVLLIHANSHFLIGFNGSCRRSKNFHS